MRCIILMIFVLLLKANTYSQVGIGTTNPDPSSVLDVQSTNKGLLIPRVSLNNINTSKLDGTNTAAPGLLIYNTNASVIGGNGIGLYYWKGSTWSAVTPSGGGGGASDGWSLSGNNVGDNDFLGTTRDYKALKF